MAELRTSVDRNPENGTPPLGLAGNMCRMFIHSPLTPLLYLACLSLGIMGLLITPRQEDPQIDVPMVDVFYEFPGASSEQVASLASDPLERMMSEIPGVKHVYSASQRGGGMVTVEFDVGQKMEPSLVKLYDKLMSNMDKIPPGVSQPLVKPKAVDDVPVVALTLWSDAIDDAGLRLLALEVMQRLKEVRNTSQSFIVGGRSEQLRVEVLPERVRGFGIGMDQIANVIRTANTERGIGSYEAGGRSVKVNSGGFLKHAADLEGLIVGVFNDSPVYLRDVAEVIEGPGEAANVVLYSTGPAAPADSKRAASSPAVTIAIAKKVSTNGVTVADDVLAKVESLKGHLIPDNVEVAVTRNYGKTANDKVNRLITDMSIATGMVTVLIFFFLGFRPMVVVAAVIPVIILLTIFSAWVLSFTIDRVSLFALIFSIGILVDDATVVVENIYRRWLANSRVDTETTIDAVREVGNPTVLATLTIIAALLPMGFVSGMMGPYMRPIPILGSVAMAFSLFAAFIFTPWFAIRVRPGFDRLQRMVDAEHRTAQKLDGFFRATVGALVNSARKARIFRLTIWGAFGVACSLFYTTHVAVKMLPLDNKPEFNVVVNMPDGTALPITANAVQKLSERLLELPEVTAVQTYAGTASPFNFNGLVRHYYLRQNPWEGDIQVQLLHINERDRSSHQIALEARDKLTPLARELGAIVQVVEMPPGPPVLQTMVAEIYGPDAETRRQVARDMTRIFASAESVVDVDNYLQEPHDMTHFSPARKKAEHRGISVDDITRQLEMVMGGYKLGDAKLGRELEPRYIVLQAPLAVRSDINRLGELPIGDNRGHVVPLAELGDFVSRPQDPVIYHKDLRPIEYVTGEVSGRLAAPVYGMTQVARLLKDYKTPDGVTLTGTIIGPPDDGYKSAFEWTGEWTVTYETFRDMGLAFMAALVLIYMLIVIEFGNFRLPGIIMAPIPLTLIGIIPGHWLLGAEFTATSMIGWIALAGIIVRNSILLVDFSKNLVYEGVPVQEAVIRSVRTRTRPILITQLTTMAGSSMMIHDPIFQGMAISTLFGAGVSTILTLFVIPLYCARARRAAWAESTADPDACHPGDVDEVMACALEDMAAEAATGQAVAREAPASAEPAGPGMKERAGTVVAAIGAAVSFADRATGHPVANLLAIPYFLWQASGEMIRAVLALQRTRGRTGGAPAGGQPGGPSAGPSPLDEAAAARPTASAAPHSVGPEAFAFSDPPEAADIGPEPTRTKGDDAKPETPAGDETAKPGDAATPVAEDAQASRPNGPSAVARTTSTKRSSEKDDLKEINGIGPKIEKMLNAQGVFTFAQLADLDAAALQGGDSIVDLAGRIEREDWRGQARRLLKQAREG